MRASAAVSSALYPLRTCDAPCHFFTMVGGLTLLMLLAAAEPAVAQPDRVATFRCRSDAPLAREDVLSVRDAYGRRSVAVIRAALIGHARLLRQIVLPSAKFTVFKGDVGLGPRGTGAEALIEFAKQIGPASYQYSAGSAGPFWTDPCGDVSVELLLSGEQSEGAVIATFKYREGLLAGVVASRVHVTRGRFGPEAIR